MPPPIKREDTFKHPLYPHARCYVDEGVIYTQINAGGKRIRQSTGLRYTGVQRTDNHIKKQALDILEARIQNKPEPHQYRAQMSVYKAFDAFFAEQYSNSKTRGRARELITALRHYLPEDMPMDADNLRETITKQRNILIETKRYSTNTTRKHLQSMRMLFNYAYERGWIDRNPIVKSVIPRAEKSIPNPLSMIDVDRICNAIHAEAERGEKYVNFPRLALEIKLLALTALRPVEFLALRWDWISTDYIEVRKAKGNRPRKIAIAIIPGLRECLDKLRTYRTEKVAVWNNSQNYNDVLRRISTALGLESRSLYNLRDTAINHWRDSLKFNPNLSAAMAGNTVQVQRNHYLLELEIEKFLSSDSPELAPKNEKPSKF